MKIDIQPVVYEEDGKTYRKYDEQPQDKVQERVKNHYFNQHQKQTVEFVKSMQKKWLSFSHANMPILDCLDLLAGFLDESDPDVEEANLFHAYQTAERLREAHPDKPWMHLAGLVHDLGKIMGVWGEHQWAITGDTYPVGCKPDPSIVYGVESFDGNPDLNDSRYNTDLGIYESGCGFENLLMCWTHDEYLYQVLKNHESTLPEEALYAIRFHSFYPAHSHGAYKQFESERDKKLHESIMMLNACDLYSKNDARPDIATLKPYYQSLVDKYIPGSVKW
ncbi:unnamed protein product, partial [Mesorhabditis belari]|uniref:Inositol oxygenase n=1 Tax=Mesorhabditis belari TaxID=2138241 RepID=A0AAF3J6N1_9BILA